MCRSVEGTEELQRVIPALPSLLPNRDFKVRMNIYIFNSQTFEIKGLFTQKHRFSWSSQFQTTEAAEAVQVETTPGTSLNTHKRQKKNKLLLARQKELAEFSRSLRNFIYSLI